MVTGSEQRLSWGENRVPTGGFSFPVNIQIMLVFGSGGRKIARERKEKGAGAGKLRVLVFLPPNLNMSEKTGCFLH